MQTSEAKVRPSYESGFPRKVTRNKYNIPLNERLKAARSRKGLSASGVVAELKKQGVSIGHSTLQGYEADENSLNHRYPSLPVLLTLADFYECSLDYLFGVSDKFKRQTLTKQAPDLKDILDLKGPVSYNGVQLTKKQRLLIATIFEEVQ